MSAAAFAKAERKARRAHMAHSLERLRERYCAYATEDDVFCIRDRARHVYKSWIARQRLPGEPWVIYRGLDCIETAVGWREFNVRVVYVPRFDALRTVLPPAQGIEAGTGETLQDGSTRSAKARSREGCAQPSSGRSS